MYLIDITGGIFCDGKWTSAISFVMIAVSSGNLYIMRFVCIHFLFRSVKLPDVHNCNSLRIVYGDVEAQIC
jgi:hypothetical protein